MKKKIASFLLFVVIVGAVFYGMGRTQADERQKIQYLYEDNYDISIASAVNETTDKAQNLIKLARKYTEQNSELENLAQGIEKQIETLYAQDGSMADPKPLKEIYALAGSLAADLETVTADTADAKYTGGLLAELRSLQDQIGHAEYNVKAKEWNQSLADFPKSFLKEVKIGSKPIFEIGSLYEYGDF